MGRIIGLIGCTCLVLAAMRLANLSHVDSLTLKGGEDRGRAQQKLTPRQHFRQGQELYLRGQYLQALPHLEEATLASSGLSATERRQADDCLVKARQKVQSVAVNQSRQKGLGQKAIVRGQSDVWGDDQSSSDSDSDAVRDRVKQLMIQAKAAYKNGDTPEAIKLAKLANNLARGARLTFDRNEVSPGDLLARLAPAKPADLRSELSGDDHAVKGSSIRQVAGSGSSRNMIQLAGGDVESADEFAAADQDESPVASKPRRIATPKEQAMSLLAQAREDIQAGRYEDARKRALEANELGVSYKVLDEDRPEMVLAEVDRRLRTTTIPRQTSGKSAKDLPAAGRQVATNTDNNISAEASDVDVPRKERAVELLKQARKDLQAGRLDAAQAKVEQVQKMRVAFSFFEDLPEVVLNEIEERRTIEAGASQEKQASAVSGGDLAQAKSLLSSSKKAMKEGRLEEARELAMKADRLKVAFGLFDETPDIVLNDISRAESKRANTKSRSSSGVNLDANKSVALQSQAVDMLQQARELMKSGRFDEARLKALQVEELGIQLPVSADSPELVLADLGKAESSLASRSKSPKSDMRTANVTDDDAASDLVRTSGKSSQDGLVAANVKQVEVVEEFSEFSQSGLSASKLYDRGMAELKRGKREIAYRAFKAAHDSGQRLDPVRTQRLSVYLRDLSPRNIQLASNQVEAPAESTPLDAVRQEQLVKFEHVREEVMNSVFKAEHLKSTDPEKALELIDQTLAKVEGADLSPAASAPLLKTLNRTRASLRSEIEQQLPNIELRAENKRVKDRIKGEIENAVRIDQETAKAVEEFNDLMNQQRYPEAVLVAQKAQLLNPKDPAVVQMVWKGKFAMQNKFNDDLKSDKEDSRLRMINDLERSIVHNLTDKDPMQFDEKVWSKISHRKDKYGSSNKVKSEDELRMEKSLQKRISLHENNSPLVEVLQKIKTVADIDFVIDEAGLEDVGITSQTPVTIDVETITVKSALNLILGRLDLGYRFADEVLNINNRTRNQGNLEFRTYPVTDLVIPIPNFGSTSGDGTTPMSFSPTPGARGFGSQAYLNPQFGGQAFAQVGPNGNGFAAVPPMRNGDMDGRSGGSNRNADFTALTDLITSTIAPESWEQGGGEATVRPYPGTLSLVIRQTQKVHEEIHDLLQQLRRLQDLQVTIEVRFVTVADRFFERIGIDFDFNIKPTTGYPKVDNSVLPIPAFGAVQLPQSGLFGSTSQAGQTSGGQQQQGAGGQQAGAAGGQQGGQQGQTGTTGQTGTSGAGLFQPGPTVSLVNNPKNTTIVGLSSPTTFTQDLTVPFQQGSFNVGIPTFGGYNPKAGVETGIAILSDLEAFFFIQAAQGDQRTNLMFAPKITLFNGQTAQVSDTKQRPFVSSLIPTVGIGAVGYTPIVTTINEGVTLSATAVVSADRRFVRLTLNPNFTSITDVFTFQATGAGGGGAGGGGGAVGGGGGGNQQGGQGGFGGGQFGGGGGGQAGGGGQFGIGGGLGSMQIMQSLYSQQVGGQGGGGQVGGQGGGGQVGGQGGGQAGGQAGGAAGGGQVITVQQPVREVITIQTTVSVPDGGTVLLGGIKRLKEGRTMSGVPILNKIPYVSRLFKNSGVGRETESLMMMVTPRIIIQEEEESLLGQSRE